MILGACLLAASATVVFWAKLQTKGRRTNRSAHRSDEAPPTVWLFDGDTLVDASKNAWAWLPDKLDSPRWSDFSKIISEDFPKVSIGSAKESYDGKVLESPTQNGMRGRLSVEVFDSITRVEFVQDRQVPPPHEPGTDDGYSAELANLSAAVNMAPNPIWRIDPDGQVVWRNAAYLRLEKNLHHASGQKSTTVFPVQPVDQNTRTRRVPVVQEELEKKLWFDVTVVPDNHGALCYSTDVNALVEGENAQRNFVQTLAKTFAQLSIGLAIFDRNRQLALFNPALIDLTSLPAEFLSARPNLLTFFDRLRDRRMMPEPKDYQSWRQKMAELVQAASDGRYQETWSLPSGSVYSVTGRPHPDGAIAFLIEDITAEITLTRRFRSELELGQSVLDKLNEAIVVFSPQGSLTFSNRAYRQLWSVDPEQSFAQVTVLDATKTWRDKCDPNPVFGEIREFTTNRDQRTDWGATITLTNRMKLDVLVSPLQNGSTMVSFATGSDTNNTIKTISEPEPAKT